MNSFKHALAALTVAGLLPLAPAAFADPVQRPESPLSRTTARSIGTDDLDLAKPEQVAALYERIRAAARSLCESEHSALWDVKRTKHRRDCFEQAVDQAVASANEPRLAALHRSAERVARR